VAGQVVVDSTKNYVFTNWYHNGIEGYIAGATTLVKASSGTLTLLTPNTYYGGTVISTAR